MPLKMLIVSLGLLTVLALPAAARGSGAQESDAFKIGDGRSHATGSGRRTDCD